MTRKIPFAILTAALSVGLWTTASADPRVTPRTLARKSAKVNRTIRHDARNLDRRSQLRVNALLDQLQIALDEAGAVDPGRRPRPNPRPRPRPRPNPDPRPRPEPRAMYRADCHVDDDSNFDFDQVNLGELTGEAPAAIHQECKMLSQNMYGARGTAGIKNLEPLGRISPANSVATCHIDDDRNFDTNQDVVGIVHGTDAIDVLDQCERLAESIYGARGSAGLVDLNKDRPLPHGMMAAECWLDDDDFDFNQFYGGRVMGRSMQDLTTQCRNLATRRFGARGTSGVKNIER